MNKKLIILATASLCFLYLFSRYFSPVTNTQASELKKAHNNELVSKTTDNNKTVKSIETETSHSKPINYCTKANSNPSAEIEAINSILILALEKELTSGASTQELLSYADQYENFYSSFPKLLFQARLNIEKRKYTFTDNLNILGEWQGVSVIQGFTRENMPQILQQLKAMQNQPFSVSLPIKISDKPEKSDILKLADNTDTFNTYLTSQLKLYRQTIFSPSTLLILTAEHLTLEEFESVLSRHTFTVNEVATALLSDLPTPYLDLIIKNTQLIESTPIIGNADFYNLADLATNMFNVDALKLLEKHDVKPTNQPGVLTALDIAVINLPRDARMYEDLASFPERYLDTIKYLKDKGYKAHGKLREENEETTVYFKAPHRENFNTSYVLHPRLKNLLHEIELIPYSLTMPKQLTGNSSITEAINELKVRKEAYLECRRQS